MGGNLGSSMSGHLGFLFRSAAVAVFAMFGGVWFAPALAAGLPRIASMNVCTDQLLIPLADPEQILGLSRFSRDAWQSWAADDARRYPTLSGGAEDVLVLAPDIVVARSFDKRSTRELLKEQGLHLAKFAVPRNLDEVKAQIRRMGEIAGHSDRATAEIVQIDAAIARARTMTAPRRGGRVAPTRYRQTLSGAPALPPRLGIRQRQPGQLAPDRDRAVQRGRRSRRRDERVSLA